MPASCRGELLMILYMVLQQKLDGSLKYRIGGGSSTPAMPRVYDSLARARVYIRGSRDMYITKIDTDKTENTI